MKSRPLIAIAHRGAHARYPENSLPAILAALDAGADGVEIDVHGTSDGRLVVHHDPGLADGREISRLSGKELAAVELAPGIPVPFLEEVLEAVAGKAILFIETKAQGIEFSVIRAVRRGACECAVHSFHHVTIRNIKLTMPALRTGILTSGTTETAMAAALATRADDVWHEAGGIDATLVRECHRAGKQVIAWTVNSATGCQHLATLGVDGICTDDLSLIPAEPR